VKIRIPENLGISLRKEIFKRGGHEYVAFALVSHTMAGNEILVLVKDIEFLAEQEYVETLYHGAHWRGSATIRILNRALAGKLGILLFHAHEYSESVGLSMDDVKSARELLPVYQNLIPDRPHGSIVIGHESAAGIVLLPGEDAISEVTSVRWLGDVMRDWTPHGNRKISSPVVPAIYSTQALLIGSSGQRKLSHTKVAVVGLSGGGSHVVQQLSHLGVGEIIAIDPDISEEDNRHRVIGMTKKDIREETPKVEVMRRMARSINDEVALKPVGHLVSEEFAITELKRADVVIGCVDSLHARADIQALCLRYLIPYVDIGLLIVPGENGSVSIGGNIITSIPGRACLWCMRFLSEKKLAEETGGKPRSYFQGTEKQAQVVSFNGLLASAAMNELLQLVTGFGPSSTAVSIKKFDGVSNTLEDWKVEPLQNCPICRTELAAGDPVWEKL